MIAYPAIDLRNGRAVQLVGGRPGSERVSVANPVALARLWVEMGFGALHVIDLDAAFGEGDNRLLIASILDAVTVPVQVGGGIRDDTVATQLLEAGARQIILGTRAIGDRAWLERQTSRNPDRVIVAADMRNGRVVTHGWTADTALRIEDFVDSLDGLPLGAVLVTDVGREGRMTGADVERFTSIADISPHPIIAAGGIATVDDLRALAKTAVAGAVLGMALYTGALDARAVALEFSQ
ncbi:MAG: HisA/HisF-related TIM barrel protein [Longimicrobiales bacterium]